MLIFERIYSVITNKENLTKAISNSWQIKLFYKTNIYIFMLSHKVPFELGTTFFFMKINSLIKLFLCITPDWFPNPMGLAIVVLNLTNLT